MSLTSFGSLFNTVADPSSAERKIHLANNAYEQEYIEGPKKAKIRSCLSTGEVTAKVNRDGYNLHVSRLDNETNKEWAKRTQSIAERMNTASNGEIVVTHKTFKSGRIIAQVQADTVSDSLFKAVA